MTVEAREPDLRAIFEGANGVGTYGAAWASGTPWGELDRADSTSLKPLSVADYLALDFPVEQWLVDKLLPKSGLGLILAAEKTGKSFFALQLALCVGAGVDFVDRPVRRSSVLLIEEEGSPAGYQRRMRRQVAALGLDPAAVSAHFLVRKQVRLDDPAILDAIGALVRELGIRLVVVGPLSQVAQIEDENKSGEINALVRRLNGFVAEHELLLLLVHHRRKSGNGQGRPKGVSAFFESARGSNALVAAIDVGIGLYREQSEEDAWMYVLQRDAESYVQPLRWDTEALDFTAREEETTASTNRMNAYLALLRQYDVVTTGFAASMVGDARNTAQRRLDQLVGSGQATMVRGPRARREYSIIGRPLFADEVDHQ